MHECRYQQDGCHSAHLMRRQPYHLRATQCPPDLRSTVVTGVGRELWMCEAWNRGAVNGISEMGGNIGGASLSVTAHTVCATTSMATGSLNGLHAHGENFGEWVVQARSGYL